MDCQKDIRLAGAAWGDPFSAGTYSGVPYHLFGELTNSGHLVGRVDLKQSRFPDLFRGALDWKRTLAARAPRRNAFWRYLPESIELLAGRMQAQYAKLPSHDAVLQFGVAGLPDATKPLIAHVEISVETAASSPVFSATYGFLSKANDLAKRAIVGERHFLSKCALVWTNSEWTAEGLRRQGVSDRKLWIYPPGCGFNDPGQITRQWNTPHILFVGKVWGDKGGPLLIEAFRLLKRHCSQARLTVIGCNPPVSGDGIRFLGFLDKQDPAQAAVLENAYKQATIFCMPSLWESVGLVYMEAAQYGLPVVMLKGQGREDLFPESMALILDSPDAGDLASALIQLADDPAKMQAMGRAGRDYVIQNYTWPVVTRRLVDRIQSVLTAGHSTTAIPALA